MLYRLLLAHLCFHLDRHLMIFHKPLYSLRSGEFKLNVSLTLEIISVDIPYLAKWLYHGKLSFLRFTIRCKIKSMNNSCKRFSHPLLLANHPPKLSCLSLHSTMNNFSQSRDSPAFCNASLPTSISILNGCYISKLMYFTKIAILC